MLRRASTVWRVAVPVLLAVLTIGAAAYAADATGTWKWTMQRGDNPVETTLKLEQDGDKLTGTISGRQGSETEIENGKVSGETVSFEVTREFNGNRFTMTYSGKLAEDTIEGEVKFERDGEPVSRPCLRHSHERPRRT